MIEKIDKWTVVASLIGMCSFVNALISDVCSARHADTAEQLEQTLMLTAMVTIIDNSDKPNVVCQNAYEMEQHCLKATFVNSSTFKYVSMSAT